MDKIKFFFKNEGPYLYGLFARVDGDGSNPNMEKPFIISKKLSQKGEITYGTIIRIINKMYDSMNNMYQFNPMTQKKLEELKINPPKIRIDGIDAYDLSRINHPIAEVILDEQEELMENCLLTISNYLRLLADFFPHKIDKRKVKVFNYEKEFVDYLRLRWAANMIVHQRYLVIRDNDIVDLISDNHFMADNPQMGLSINFSEYIQEVFNFVSELDIADLIDVLKEHTDKLKSSSDIKDIILIMQNLHSIGEILMRSGKHNEGIIGELLRKITKKYLNRPNMEIGKTYSINLSVHTPRFLLLEDMENKKIRASINMPDGNEESKIITLDHFYKDFLKNYGNVKLYTGIVHPTPATR